MNSLDQIIKTSLNAGKKALLPAALLLVVGAFSVIGVPSKSKQNAMYHGTTKGNNNKGHCSVSFFEIWSPVLGLASYMQIREKDGSKTLYTDGNANLSLMDDSDGVSIQSHGKTKIYWHDGTYKSETFMLQADKEYRGYLAKLRGENAALVK